MNPLELADYVVEHPELNLSDDELHWIFEQAAMYYSQSLSAEV